MTSSRFIDAVPLQHPRLFPQKRTVDGKVINTSKVVGGRTVVRDVASVRGIAIHQTACVFGPTAGPPYPLVVRPSAPPAPAKRHLRALKIPAHVVAFQDGVFVQGAPLQWLLYHANALNDFTLGLECEGQFPGLLDDPRTPMREDTKTFWPGGGGVPTPLTPLAVETFCDALTHLYEAGRRLGMPIEFGWAHRQSNGSKPSDPGQEVWQRVMVQHGQDVLGLKLKLTDTFRDGRPIPAAWGGAGPY